MPYNIWPYNIHYSYLLYCSHIVMDAPHNQLRWCWQLLNPNSGDRARQLILRDLRNPKVVQVAFHLCQNWHKSYQPFLHDHHQLNHHHMFITMFMINRTSWTWTCLLESWSPSTTRTPTWWSWLEKAIATCNLSRWINVAFIISAKANPSGKFDIWDDFEMYMI